MGERKILQKKIKNKNIFSFRFPDIYSKQNLELNKSTTNNPRKPAFDLMAIIIMDPVG